jgi:hypothetical protein
MLIGIMREALKLIEKRFLGSKLGKEYVPLLSTGATETLNRLKNCKSDWCCAAVRSGAVTAAIGSTLLRSHGSIRPTQ